jgi:hypothetical protein
MRKIWILAGAVLGFGAVAVAGQEPGSRPGADRRVASRGAGRRDHRHLVRGGRRCLFHRGIDIGGRSYDAARTAEIGAAGSAGRRHTWRRQS